MMFRLVLVLIAVLFASEGQAEIYKCEAENGDITYSQVPCLKQKTTTVTTSVPKAREPVDCRWAATFADDVARQMRSGMASDQMFNMYGGIDSVSAGTVNIINYVYRFRGNEAMPVERISSLAASMCKAGSLGDVRCESLPYGQDLATNRCDTDAEDSAAPQQPLVLAPDQLDASNGDIQSSTSAVMSGAMSGEISGPASSNIPAQATNNSQALDEERQEECRDGFRDQIDAIDAEMRDGYSSEEGERYRQRLRMLTTRMREC
jgi:hypothetical protein